MGRQKQVSRLTCFWQPKKSKKLGRQKQVSRLTCFWQPKKSKKLGRQKQVSRLTCFWRPNFLDEKNIVSSISRRKLIRFSKLKCLIIADNLFFHITIGSPKAGKST